MGLGNQGRYDASVSGGSEAFRYYAAGGLTNALGTISPARRVSFRGTGFRLSCRFGIPAQWRESAVGARQHGDSPGIDWMS